MKLVAAFAALSLSVAATDQVITLRALKDADVRLQAIGDRLATANVALCVRRQAVVGAVPVATSAFPIATRDAVVSAFHLSGPSGVEAVIAGGAADVAGLRPGDRILTIAGSPVPEASTRSAVSTRDQIVLADALAALEPDKAAPIGIERGGRQFVVDIVPPAGCAARFELEIDAPYLADSDGHLIRIGSAFIENLDDDRLAAVVAHELAHGILGHRMRLDAAHVDRGLLSAFGRNAAEIRRTEEEADRLSVTLLHNAGYDPRAAARFWLTYGKKLDGGLFRSPNHPSAKNRANLLTAAAAALPAGSDRLCPAIAPGCERRRE